MEGEDLALVDWITDTLDIDNHGKVNLTKVKEDVSCSSSIDQRGREAVLATIAMMEEGDTIMWTQFLEFLKCGLKAQKSGDEGDKAQVFRPRSSDEGDEVQEGQLIVCLSLLMLC